MNASDLRSMSKAARHQRWVLVIRLRKAGHTLDEIAQQRGRTDVFSICKRYEQHGAKALPDTLGGSALDGKRLPSAQQKVQVQKLITEKSADQPKMPCALWTRCAVAQLIEQRFGFKRQVRTMGSIWPAGASHRKSA
jgi:transposase